MIFEKIFEKILHLFFYYRDSRGGQRGGGPMRRGYMARGRNNFTNNRGNYDNRDNLPDDYERSPDDNAGSQTPE